MSWLKYKDDLSGKIHCNRDYTLSMPRMSWGSMSENWLLKELGDIHWSMIAEGLGVASDKLTDGNGNRLYASFVRLCWESSEGLGVYRENQPLSINSELSRFGMKMFFSDAAVTSSGSKIAATLMSVFSSRNADDNRELKNAAPLAHGDGRITTHETLPAFGRQYFNVKGKLFPQGGLSKNIKVDLAGRSFDLDTTPLFTTDYTIDPFDDINGVGLIYFAAFPKISDKCERLYFNQQKEAGVKDWAYRTSCVARDIYYFGNANPQEQLLYQLDACEYVGEQLVQLSASIFRKKDGQLIAKIFSIKALSAADAGETLARDKPVEPDAAVPVGNENIISREYDRETLSEAIAGFLSSMMGVAAITGSTNLRLQGIESVMFLELSAYLNDNFQLKSNPSRFYGHSTVDEIVQYLLDDGPKETGASVNKTDDKRYGEQTEDIAIIGTSFRLPGAGTFDALWDILINEQSVITATPSERWNWPSWIDFEVSQKGINRGGYILDIDKFDASFFRISPREAELMDPQQRLLLELTWELFERAGYKAGCIKGSRTGVYVGASGSDYELMLQKEKELESSIGTGTALSILANRISYFYDLEGPSLQIDTACSSSLVAVHEAVNAIRAGECTQAIAGGIHLMCHYAKSLSYYKSGMLSIDGKCQTFDEKANGYVRGEGAVLMLLKPLARALEDGDQVLGLIKATAVNHGGQSGGLTVPNPVRQQELLKAAYQKAGIDVSTVSYIEAHGTGTSLGDPIEVTGLTTAFNHLQKHPEVSQPQEPWCGIGSVKTNIGHLEAAAGMAGMLKVLLSMKKQYIPATINFSELNKKIELKGSPFYIQHTSHPWQTANNDLPLRAGISSFGIGGVNCHVVLESFVQIERVAGKAMAPYVFVLSARNKNRLAAYATDILAYLEQQTDLVPERIACTLQTAREEMEERLAIVYGTVQELKDVLHSYMDGTLSKECFTGNAKSDKQLTSIFREEPSIVQRWMDNRDLEYLARYWCFGLSINWNLLYGAEKPRKTNLPVYPFARERYWLPAIVSEIKATAGVQQLHPLLHSNTSDLSEQRYTSIYTGNEKFLSDHKAGEEKILPGVAYLELARAAGAFSTGEKITLFREVYWLNPIRVKDAPQEVHIRVYPYREDIGYEVYTNSGTNRQVHGKGVLGRQEISAATSLDILAIQQRLGQSVGRDACYSFFRQLGLDYGPGFRGIEQLYYNETEALSIISLPAETGYELMPGLMDGALQTCLGLSFGQQNNELLLPFSVREVLIYGELDERMYCYATRSGNKASAGHVASYNIDLLNTEGQVRLSFRELSLLPAKGTAPVKQPVPATFNKDIHLYDSVWQASSLAENKQLPGAGHLLLLAGATAGLAEKLREILKIEIVTVTGECRLEYFMDVLLSIRKKMEEKTPANILLIYPEEDFLHYGFIAGLLKTAGREYPKLRSKTVGVERLSLQDVEELLKIVSSEGEDLHEEVRYRGGVREVKLLREVTSGEGLIDAGVGIRSGGVYLITGGAGGLGRLFAAHISQTPGTRVILCGRSEPADWLSQYPSVEYRRCDVGDASSVAALISGIRNSYGALHGIIHAAGVLRDSFIVNKTAEGASAVLSAKISGVRHLDEASVDCALDFMVLFSSISGVLGNIGQGDYAAANAYLDNYALYRNELVSGGRRRGHTLSIGWPLWASEGMQLDEESVRYLERQWGMQPMPAATGIQLFDQLLQKGHEQVVVFYGKKDKFMNQEVSSAKATKTALVSADNTILEEQVTKQVVSLISENLKLDIASIAVDEELGDYGFDSISLTKLSNQINNHYELSLTPTVFYSYSTVEKLVKHLLEDHAGLIAKRHSLVTGTRPVDEQPPDEKASRFIRETAPVPSVERPSVAERSSVEPIAIIGMSGRFPGSADLTQFWEHLKANHDLITEVPLDRWDWRQYYGDPYTTPGKTLSRWGGFITDIDKFDALYFNISPLEAELMDPQQRITLESVYGALEDAGIAPSGLKGSNTGVFIGVSTSDYAGMLRSSHGFSSQAQYSTGSAHSVLVNRISYLLDVHGPSEPIDTACSSSLVALHRAVENIRNGYCDIAIAGGVNALLSPDLTLSFSQAGMLSADGRCKSFDQRANGYVRGEGVGVIILKPLSSALAAGDHIYGVIRGSAVNHGGKANTLTSPNPNAQRDLLLKAYRASGTPIERVSYIEAHGTGTSLGDPIEMEGLKQAFRQLYTERGLTYGSEEQCRVGSVKANIGHLEAAAGIAGVMKVLLSMQHGMLPGNPHLESANEYLKLEDSIFRLQSATQPWHRGAHDRLVAGVSSFGFGGANAHVIIEEYRTEVADRSEISTSVMVVLSARNKDRLVAQVSNLLGYLEGTNIVDLSALGYTLQTGRDALEERLAMVVSDKPSLIGLLRQYQSGEAGDYFAGNTKKERSDFLLEGGAGRAYIDYAILHQEQRSLARLWVRGVELDWELLYSGRKPVKISLPAYPFARERYWIPGVASEVRTTAGIQQLHPLLHSNTSDLSEQRYTSIYTGNEKFLADHKVGEEKILPGVAYLELARVAGTLSTHGKISAFREVSWLSPIGVNGTPREVHIRVYPYKEDIGYEVYTNNETNRQVHGKGILSRQELPAATFLDIHAIQQRLGQSAGRDACYSFFRQLGLDYGLGFRGIEQLYYNETEALSIISLPAEAGYELMPGLMDSALQTCLGLSFGQQEQGLSLPFSVREVLIYGELEERMYCYARRSRNKVSAGPVAIYDIDMLNTEGQVRVSFRELSMLPLRVTALPKPAPLAKVTSSHEGKQKIVQALTELCAGVLKLKEDNIEADTEFAEYGMDSIIMMQLLNKLETRFSITVEPTAIINYPTITLLAKYLEEEKLPAGKEASEEVQTPVPVERPQIVRFESKGTGSGKVAVIGMSCRLPGSDNINEYWENLQAGKELISEVSADRWDAASVYSSEPAAGKTYTTKGGFIKSAGSFDARYFNISDYEALSMDPQQRIVLELSRELLAHAGYGKEELANTSTGVYIGAKDNNYIRNNHHLLPEGTHQHIIVNNISNMIAARLSDFYNLKGTSQVIDTACSSSLVAIHQACEDIISGKCAMAIAGGISIMVDAFMHIGFSQAQVLSRDGRSYVFDERASGFVMGEGGGLVLLKDHAQAVADGDQIFGIIMGSHVNNDGKTIGVTVPNKEGQKEVIAATLAKAGISAAEISYYEAHGTGTLLGDPIEIKAATEVYRESTSEKQYCAIGSVKSNLGHTMTSAGVAGLIKILLQMQHHRIAPTLHCENPHPRFRFSESPFYPNTTLKEWTVSRKIAAISSFGFGGTNCHAVLEAPLPDMQAPRRKALPVEKISRGFYWLGQEMKSETHQQQASVIATVTYDEPLMRDHLISGKQVLMGVAYLSMCIDLGRKSFPGKALKINKLLFSNPLTLEKEENARIRSSYDTTSGNITVVYDIQGKDSLCASGELVPVDFKEGRMDIEALKAGSLSAVEGAAFYQQAAAQRCYGPTLRTVQQCWYLPGGELLALLRVSEDLKIGGNGFTIHPAIFDGAHVAGALCMYRDITEAVRGHWPPLLIKTAEVAESLSLGTLQECYCYVTPVKVNEQVSTFDFRILQPDGVVIINLSGFTTKSRPAENARPMPVKNMTEQVKEYLGKKIGEILKTDPGKISVTRNFMDMGLDSAQMIGIPPVVEKELGIELYPTIFFEYQNIDELGNYLAIDHAANLQSYFAHTISAPFIEPPQPVIIKPAAAHARPLSNGDDLNDIAIIGMSGYLPQSPDLAAFWSHLEASRDLVTEISGDHWDYRPWFDENRDAPNKSYSKWGGMLKDIDKFDPLFFGISPIQAMWMDPQIRLLLQSAYHTFEDAGVVNEIRNTRTGVFVGSCFHEYWDEIVRAKTPMRDYEHSSSAMSSLSASVSYYFDLQGPSIPLDNACASSMTALHLACQAIRNKEADMALIGGLNVLLSPLHYVYFSRIQALSPTGRCHTFDKKADGYVPGEGVVSILLKPLSKAIADGNTIHGVIKGSAINHVGKSNNPTSPRPELQTRLLEDAWEAAGINPENISYLEAHGTGTPLGDPIEVNALKRAFRKYTTNEQFCYLGSAKAHLGHLEGAAGLASIIKVLLMMKHRVIPRMPNFETLNPYVKLEGSPFKINQVNEPWHSDGPLLAGISSFGMTGNNAHVVIEEYKAIVPPPYTNSQPAIVVLSAREADRLQEQVENLKRHVTTTPDINIHDLAYTLQFCREPMEERLAVVVKDAKELETVLSVYLQGKAGNFFKGSVRKDGIASVPDVAITAMMSDKEYTTLASQWATGANIKWSLLYPSGKPARINLPVYPFAKERYWMPEQQEQETSGLTDSLHPLLHFAQQENLHPLLHLHHNGDNF